MIKSMTGFGRAVHEIDGYVITVEIKSVNHRYFEFSSRIPRAYGFLEDKLKSFVNARVARGKVDCFVRLLSITRSQAHMSRHSKKLPPLMTSRRISAHRQLAVFPMC